MYQDTRHPKKKQGYFGIYLFIVIYTLSLGAYYLYLNFHLQNFPRSDDFRAILDNLILWKESKSPQNSFSLLFAQHNEHRIFTVNLFSIFLYEIEKVVNFKHLTLFGNLFYVTIPLLFLASRRLEKGLYIPIIPLFFSATTYGSSHWAMTSLSNFPVVWYATLASILAFSTSRAANWIAIPCAFLATFSQGNGIIIFILLTILSLIKGDTRLKAGYVVAFLLSVILYFHDWHRPPNPSPTMALHHPFDAVRYLFGLLGSATLEEKSAVALAAALLTTYAAVRVKTPRVGPAEIILSFIFFSAVTVTLNRLVFPSSSIASKYSIYSLLFIAVIFCELIESVTTHRKRLILASVLTLISTFYCLYSWHITERDRASFLERMSHLRIEPDGTFSGIYDLKFHIVNSTKTLKSSHDLGIYTPPTESE